jgi:uncharacterized protein YndB with AHSA1/START domain
MAVDVLTEIHIARPPAVVAAFAGDPARAPEWYVNIHKADLLTPGPFTTGSRVAFEARFLGRKLSYAYEVRELIPGQKLVMSTADGPFPMETTYTWEPDGDGTRMTLRNRGEPSGFSTLVAPLMARQMRSANQADLEKLKRVLEAG